MDVCVGCVGQGIQVLRYQGDLDVVDGHDRSAMRDGHDTVVEQGVQDRVASEVDGGEVLEADRRDVEGELAADHGRLPAARCPHTANSGDPRANVFAIELAVVARNPMQELLDDHEGLRRAQFVAQKGVQ